MKDHPRLNQLVGLFTIVMILLFSTGSFALAQEGPATQDPPTVLEATQGQGIAGETQTGFEPVEILPGFSPQAVPDGPGYSVLSALEFTPREPDEQLTIPFGMWIQNPSTTSSGYYSASIDLPHGANLTKMTVFYIDDDPLNLSITMGYCPYLAGSCSPLAFFNSAIDTSGMQSAEVAFSITPVVNLRTSFYAVSLTLPPTSYVQFNAIRFDYNYPVYSPAVMR